MGGGEHHKDKGLLSNIAEHVVGHNHHGHGGTYPPQQGYVPAQGYNPADYPGHPPPQTSGGHGVGDMLAGGAAAAAAAYGTHQLASHGHGGHHVSHGTHNLIPGMGHYSGGKHGRHGGGKFKAGKHGKFKSGKHGKFGKRKGKGKMLGFKKWK